MDYNTVIDHLRPGKENKITRDELCVLTGFRDRKNRRMLERAADNGWLIVSTSHEKGYYLALTTADLELIVRENMSRGLKSINRARFAIKALGRDPRQIAIAEFMKLVKG